MSARLSRLIIGLAATLGSPLAAQEPVLPSVPQTLTLAEATAIASRYNPGFRQVHNDRGPAGWGVRNAYAAFIPNVTASGSVTYRGSGSQAFLTQQFTQPSSTVGSSYNLGLTWQLSGATLSQPGLAKAQLNAAEAAIDGALINLGAAVSQQYLAILQAQAQVELALLQLRRNEEFLRLAEARFGVGQATQLDVRQAEVARGQAEVALLQNRQLVTVEKLRLFQQMGVVAPEDLSLVTLTDTFPVTEPTWSLANLLAEAEDANPNLTALRAQESAARWGERAARSQWLPTLSFNASWSGFTQRFTDENQLVMNALNSAQNQLNECNYANANWLNPGGTALPCNLLDFDPVQLEQRTRDNNQLFSNYRSQPFQATFTVSLPIYTQFGRPLRISQAAAQADDAREAVQGRRLQVRTDVSQAFYSLQTAHQTIALQETNRVAAREQLRLATERYRVGSGTFFELLDAQVAAQRAEADYINAVYGYHRSVAALEAAVGRPLR